MLQNSDVSRKRGFSIQCYWNFVFYARMLAFFSRVGNVESIAVKLKRFDALSPAALLLKQETVSGSGISRAVCKSAPRSRQITTPAPHYSVFLQAGCPSCRPTKHEEQNKRLNTQSMLSNILVSHSHSVSNHGGKKHTFLTQSVGRRARLRGTRANCMKCRRRMTSGVTQ